MPAINLTKPPHIVDAGPCAGVYSDRETFDMTHERLPMKLTREQVEGLKRSKQEACARADYDAADAINQVLAACEVEEVDPVGEEAEKFKASTGTFGPWTTEEAAAFHRHMLAKHRPAFNEGRAREIAKRHAEYYAGFNHRAIPTLTHFISDAIKEYTCGSPGSSSGCGNVFINAGEKSPNHFVFDDGGCGAGSSGTASDSSKKSGTNIPPDQSPSSSANGTEQVNAPAVGDGFRWETPKEFAARRDPPFADMPFPDAIAARDFGWKHRITDGDLSIRAWQDATRPMGELAPSYGVWLRERLTQ